MEYLYNTALLFTASIAAFSFAVAWFNYKINKLKNLHEEYTLKESILNSLQTELSYISTWATSYEQKPFEEYAAKKECAEWFLPGRVIFKFDYNFLRHLLTQGPKYLFEKETIENLTKLSYSTTTFQQMIDESRRYAFGNIQLFTSTLKKFDEQKNKEEHWKKANYSPEEKDYLNMIFQYNYLLHIKLISDKNNPMGLFFTCKEAVESIVKEKANLKQVAESFLFKLVDLLAYLFIFLGLYFLIFFIVNHCYLYF